MARRQTPTERLYDYLLPDGLEAFVQERRANGRSWRLIARDLYEATGVDITYERVRTWFLDDKDDDANGGEEAA